MGTISGSKYGTLALSSVGTTSVSISSSTFVSTDFSVTRLVGMWNSTGATFLGMSWVRAYSSATSLQLQAPFFDPATGNTIAQTSGNIIQVSKNFSDSTASGFTVTQPDQVVVTSAPTFGVGASSVGVCFYDESQNITCPYSIVILGGLTVLGKLDNYSANSVSSSCIINYSTLAGSSNGLYSNDSKSNFCMYGGRLDGNNSPIYNGGYQGTAGYTMVLNGIQSPFDLISPGAGGTWGTYASRMQLINCYSISTATNAICRRWGDGYQAGGAFKFPLNTNAPISALGADSAGTYSFAAPVNQRAVITDFGANQITPGSSSNGGPILFRSSSTVAISLNVTNLIATSYYMGQGAAPVTSNTLATVYVYFQDTFSNIMTNTVGNINTTGLRSSSSTYNTNSGSTSWSPSLLYITTTGFTPSTATNTWYYALKAYGYQIISGTITTSTYSVIDTTAPNVSFSQTVTQLPDSGTSLSQSSAGALTSLSILDNLYDASCYWATTNASQATYPSISTYPITAVNNTTNLNLGSLNLTFVTTGSAFSVNTSSNTITVNSSTLNVGSNFTSFITTGSVNVGSSVVNVIYTSNLGTSSQINFTNIPSNTALGIFNASGTQQIYVTGISGSYTYNIAPGASSGTWTWATKSVGYNHAYGSFIPSAGGQSTISLNMTQKLNPDGTIMYTGSTNSLVTVTFTGITEADINIGNGPASVQNVLDISENALITSAGLYWLSTGLGELTQYNSASGNFLFMTTKWRLKALNTSSPNAQLNGFAVSADGTPINSVNGTVIVLSNVLNSTNLSLIAASVWAQLTTTATTGSFGSELNSISNNTGLIPGLF
jgi:hypothetical protein